MPPDKPLPFAGTVLAALFGGNPRDWLQIGLACASQSMTYTEIQVMSRQVMVKKVVKPKPMFSIRLSEDERKALDKAASAEDRPSSYVARRAIVEWLREKGFLK